MINNNNNSNYDNNNNNISNDKNDAYNDKNNKYYNYRYYIILTILKKMVQIINENNGGTNKTVNNFFTLAML